MEPPRALVVAELNSKKLFEPFRPRLALKTEDNVIKKKCDKNLIFLHP